MEKTHTSGTRVELPALLRHLQSQIAPAKDEAQAIDQEQGEQALLRYHLDGLTASAGVLIRTAHRIEGNRRKQLLSRRSTGKASALLTEQDFNQCYISLLRLGWHYREIKGKPVASTGERIRLGRLEAKSVQSLAEKLGHSLTGIAMSVVAGEMFPDASERVEVPLHEIPDDMGGLLATLLDSDRARGSAAVVCVSDCARDWVGRTLPNIADAGDRSGVGYVDGWGGTKVVDEEIKRLRDRIEDEHLIDSFPKHEKTHFAPGTQVDGEEAETQSPSLSKSQRQTLQALATFDAHELATAEEISEAMAPEERLSERTIQPTIKELMGFGLAERPQGPRKGARLTVKGRQRHRNLLTNKNRD